MEPLIIGVRKDFTNRKKDLPKINGFMYEPINNKQNFPHKGPIVLISNIRDNLLPGEQVILGPYCDCANCLNEKKPPVKSPWKMKIALKPKPLSRRKSIRPYRLFASTPNEERTKYVNDKTRHKHKPDNYNPIQQSTNIQTNGNLEFSDIESDSGWERRQELLTRINKDLEKQVEIELKLKGDVNSKVSNTEGKDKEKTEVKSDRKHVKKNIIVNKDLKENIGENTHLDRKKETNSVLLDNNKSSGRKYQLRDLKKNSAANAKDTQGFIVPQTVKTISRQKKKLQEPLTEENLKAKDVEVPRTSKRKRAASSKNEEEVFETPQVERLKAFGKRRTLYSPSNSFFYEQSLFKDLGE